MKQTYRVDLTWRNVRPVIQQRDIAQQEKKIDNLRLWVPKIPRLIMVNIANLKCYIHGQLPLHQLGNNYMKYPKY